MRHAIDTIVVGLITGTCTASTETQALSLADQLADTSDEIDRAVGAPFDTLGQPYDDRSQLYQRLVDLQLPTTFAIQLDTAQRVDPPLGTDAELNRYLAFIGDLLRASEHLDAANRRSRSRSRLGSTRRIATRSKLLRARADD